MDIATLTMRDGVSIAVAVYLPASGEASPALLAASPYRFDNNVLPPTSQFLWRETGPIDLYNERGYAYVNMDVRGSGRSGGEFGFLDAKEQHDLYDVVQWIAQQPWCSGKVGGIGQSYFCMLQWFMAAQRPPALACIAAHDGLNDPYRASAYNGGIPGDFFPGYWWQQNRIINRSPANGGPARVQDTDLNLLFAEHPTYDDFWRERTAWEVLDRIDVPLYSGGVWSKHMLHTRGNIEGYRKARGPKKLLMSGAPSAWAANAEFNSREFHERVLLPFYDHYLKGIENGYADRPNVEYAVRGSALMRTAAEWPPPTVQYERWFLNATSTGSVTSLNDGGLARDIDAAPPTSYTYPNPGWVTGVAGFGPGGPASGFDPVRRVLTFTSPPLPEDLEIAGPIKLELYASSTAADTDFFIKISDQVPQSEADRVQSRNPQAETVSRGWLKASHRQLDPRLSTEMIPYHTHGTPELLVPGTVYRFDISIEPMAYLFAAGHRIRLEIVNGDSPLTELLWTHYYRPDKIGTDTIYHDAAHASVLILPVDRGSRGA